jgi:hypothetical protein
VSSASSIFLRVGISCQLLRAFLCVQLLGIKYAEFNQWVEGEKGKPWYNLIVLRDGESPGSSWRGSYLDRENEPEALTWQEDS